MKSLFYTFLLSPVLFFSQQLNRVYGTVKSQNGEVIPFAAVALANSPYGAISTEDGIFSLTDVPSGNYKLVLAATGFINQEINIVVPLKNKLSLFLKPVNTDLSEVVVTGSLKETGKDDSPVNIDIITPKLFQKTSTPNLFEATSLVNGVKPQINCNVCNTGDIHINGLEGPYTLILIDGMPIVSGLSSVYGLMGIPSSMIERLEIAKGPSGALYGSEAMGGTINLITKKPSLAPKFYMDYYGTSYLENNLDLSGRFKIKKANWLSGANMYFFDNKTDINNDGFTDVTLQKRLSLFNKLSFDRANNREFSIAARYVWEDRWGGQLNWDKRFRGGDSIYGESVYTKRTEVISRYEWPTREKIYSQFSYNFHDQNSAYGETFFLAKQSTGFFQTYWNKQLNSRNDFIAGIAFKNLWYDDNTFITTAADGYNNKPQITNTLGMFLQNETTIDSLGKHKLLSGLRFDYDDIYKLIPSPRLAYKWAPTYKLIFRANFGTGFRIVNVFTEDHAALTGAREVVFKERISPEQSFNGSINTVYKMRAGKGSMVIWDAGLFYYHFTNKIFADYDSDPDKVIYANLTGSAFSRGGSLNASLAGTGKFKFTLGVTYADVMNINKDSLGELVASRQVNAPLWSGNVIVSYMFSKPGLMMDLTGNWYGPQRLPILPNDFRPEYSPWFSLLNLQISKTIKGRYEMYGGAKNLLNFIPEHPILRPQDPFDKNASDVATNPNGYTFDTTYNYAPVQAFRVYLGIRITL